MMTITTTDAKARFNALLAKVAAGETITITNHGRAVAVLSKAVSPGRKFGRFSGLVTVADDFDAPMSEAELASWGEEA